MPPDAAVAGRLASRRLADEETQPAPSDTEATRSAGAPLTVASMAFSMEGNPYPELLQAALGERGIDTVASRARLGWALCARSKLDVAHLHWLELFVHTRGAVDERWPRLAPAMYVLRAGRLLAILATLRASGVRIVWTVHNLKPHEQALPALNRLLMRAVASLADGIVVHSDFARRRLKAAYPRLRPPIWIAPHGNYTGSYPGAARGRAAQRARFGIPPEAFVFLVFGHLRPYKRIDETIAAFKALQNPDAHLIVAGSPLTDEVRRSLLAAADGHPRVHLQLGFIDDSDVAALHAAADAAVIAYAEVFSSGALLLALSLGLPVVAPHDSSAPEVVSPPALVTFETGRLTDALARISEGCAEARREAAFDAARRNSWQATAARVHAAYLGEDPDADG